MLNFEIRPAQAEDYAGIAAVTNQIESEPVTAEGLHQRDEQFALNPDIRSSRLVAVATDGEVLGFARAIAAHGHEQKDWFITVAVHKDARGQGIGQALYGDIRAVAAGGGARELRTRCKEDDAASLAFADRRGFTELHRQRESVLDLAAWDPARFAGNLDSLGASGFRMEVHEQLPEQIWPAVYACDIAATRTHPEYDGADQSWEDWTQFAKSASRPVRWALIWRGQQVVALSVTRLPMAPGGGAYTDYTCVHPEYRGKGLALAVKLLTIDIALRAGVPYLRTHNNEQNAPMLAVNRKLGYVPVPGDVVLSLPL